MEREIADLQQQGADLDAAMERRRRQFGEVLAALECVWAQLEGDAVGEEGALPDDAEPGEAPVAIGGSSGGAAAVREGGAAPMQLG